MRSRVGGSSLCHFKMLNTLQRGALRRILYMQAKIKVKTMQESHKILGQIYSVVSSQVQAIKVSSDLLRSPIPITHLSRCG